jgi:uncharacterized protein YbjT (DUF2867 family)
VLETRGIPVRRIGRTNWPRLAETLRGCDAVYLIAPNMHPDEPALVRDVLDAARTADVDRLVYHSVAAPFCPQMPHHLGKARSEDLVRRSGMRWTILQPCAYLQNLTGAVAGGADEIRVPYDVDALFGLVDLHDVGEAAAAAPTDDRHVGATYEVGGPALVSVRDVAAVAGQVLARPVRTVRIDEATWLHSVPHLDEHCRDTFLAMFRYYDEHGLPTGGLSTAALLGRPASDLASSLRRELT